MMLPIAAVVLLATAAALLARALPAQNVALIMVVLLAWEMALQAFCFGGEHLWRGWLFWPAMVIWARVVCRWMLRRRRQDWNYGVWLVLFASATTALAQWGLVFYGAAWTVALKFSAMRFASTAVCLFFLSPWFISKLPQQPQRGQP
jgi:hypothetical protein